MFRKQYEQNTTFKLLSYFEGLMFYYAYQPKTGYV